LKEKKNGGEKNIYAL